jgi:hypothetical protein
MVGGKLFGPETPVLSVVGAVLQMASDAAKDAQEQDTERTAD